MVSTDTKKSTNKINYLGKEFESPKVCYKKSNKNTEEMMFVYSEEMKSHLHMNFRKTDAQEIKKCYRFGKSNVEPTINRSAKGVITRNFTTSYHTT